jgi:glycosyltransferase involved in cell wall biosynthesis
MSPQEVLDQTAVLDNDHAPSPATAKTRPTKVLLMATAPQAVVLFLTRQISFLVSNGFEVHTIASPGIEDVPGHTTLPSTHHSLPMKRTIHPLADLRALLKLYRLMRQLKPDILQTHTPKAGLLGMIAAMLARVPIRIYTVNGLPLLTQKGVSRLLVTFTDWLACSLATEVICPSRCLRRFIVKNGFCRREKVRTLGDGGFPGVDPEKYHPGRYFVGERVRIRERYGIPRDALVAAGSHCAVATRSSRPVYWLEHRFAADLCRHRHLCSPILPGSDIRRGSGSCGHGVAGCDHTCAGLRRRHLQRRYRIICAGQRPGCSCVRFAKAGERPGTAPQNGKRRTAVCGPSLQSPKNLSEPSQRISPADAAPLAHGTNESLIRGIVQE